MNSYTNSLDLLTEEYRNLEQHLGNVNREYAFARSRAYAHAGRETMRERMLYAGALLRMQELTEEWEQTDTELEAIAEQIEYTQHKLCNCRQENKLREEVSKHQRK